MFLAISLMFYSLILPGGKQKPARRRVLKVSKRDLSKCTLFLPSALLVAVRFEPLAALVFGHLKTAFLLQVAHRYERVRFGGKTCGLCSIL